MSASLRVIKLGGSLLSLPDLKSRLLYWLDQQAAEPHNLWLVGGGVTVNHLRVWQEQSKFEDEQAHWMAIELMSLNAVNFARKMGWPCVLNWSRTPNFANLVFDASIWMRSSSLALSAPMDWRTTSDSMAALLASELSASELILLKSASCQKFESPPANCDIETFDSRHSIKRHSDKRFSDERQGDWEQWSRRMVEAGVTDDYFPIAGKELVSGGNSLLKIINFRKLWESPVCHS